MEILLIFITRDQNTLLRSSMKFQHYAWKIGYFRKIKGYSRERQKLWNQWGFLCLSVYYNFIGDTLIRFCIDNLPRCKEPSMVESEIQFLIVLKIHVQIYYIVNDKRKRTHQNSWHISPKSSLSLLGLSWRTQIPILITNRLKPKSNRQRSKLQLDFYRISAQTLFRATCIWEIKRCCLWTSDPPLER